MRHESSPAEIETLESRRLLSAAHHLVRIGSLGDSYTDEYRFYPPDRSRARGWVEQLVNNKRATFGTPSAKSRGTPRLQGYANDWALSGALSSDLPAQTAGLAQQAAAGEIDYATIFIGGNDFLNTLETLATNPANAQSALITTAQNIVTNIETAVGTLLTSSANLKVVVTTLPPVSQLPIVAALVTDAESTAVVQAADAAEIQVNSALTAFAASTQRVAIADFAGASAAFGASSTLKIGNTKINTTRPGDNPHDLFLADGLHLGTVGQGLLANVFINTIDTSFGAAILPLTNHQILKDAGLV
jgi:lysophospholipase L1-like esterase